jgi:hypothetical protein
VIRCGSKGIASREALRSIVVSISGMIRRGAMRASVGNCVKGERVVEVKIESERA